MKNLILVCVALCIPSVLLGQLAFDATAVEIDAGFGAEQLTHDFTFTNSGDYPVEILGLSSCCGFRTADLEKRLYEPGESGKITGIFTVGGRIGEYRNMITLRTDDPENPSQVLQMTIDIPRNLTLSHRLLTWQRNGEPTGQIVEVEFHPDSPYELKDVEIDGENFRVEVTSDEEKENRYLLEITPTDLSESNMAIIYLRTNPEPTNRRAFSVYTYVR